MSYCRIDEDSDVYLFLDIKGFFYLNTRKPNRLYRFVGRTDTLHCLNHLKEAGYKVPWRAIFRLESEMDKRGI